MALLFEHAQYSSYNIDMIFARENLSMVYFGIKEFDMQFIKKLSENEIYENHSICSVLPSQVLDILLGCAFDNCTLESDVELGAYVRIEEFELTDELFKLISSDVYLKSTKASKVNSIFDEFAMLCSSDLRFFVNRDSSGDDDYDEYIEEVDYLDDDDVATTIKNCFDGDTFSFSLYFTECISYVGAELVKLKELLVEIKEELYGNSNLKSIAA